MNTNIHIGSIIRKVLDQSGISYREFAHSINCERQSLYYLFNCSSIDINRLILISKVLNYDFLRNVYLADELPAIATAEMRTYVVDLSDRDLSGYDRVIIKLPKAREEGDTAQHDEGGGGLL